MALTKEMKKAVSDLVWETLMAENDKLFSTTQLRQLVMNNLGIEVSPQIIGVIMSHAAPDKYYLIKNDFEARVRYALTRINAYTLKKEKSRVFFINVETGSKTLVYDYNAPEYRYNGFGKYDTITIEGNTFEARIVARSVQAAPEWIFSYLDLFNPALGTYWYDVEELPRTLLPREMEIAEKIHEAIKEDYGHSITKSVCEAHRLMADESFDINIFNGLTKSQLQFMERFELIRRFGGFKNALAIISLVDKFCLIQIKNYETIGYSDMVATLKEMHDFDWLDNLNVNHSFDTNVKAFKAYKNKEQINLLAKRLQKLNFLNGLEVCNDFVIVVPQSLDDLTKEGKQQNNCVGHWYNNSIMRGENYIYFIRNKRNINKSYITCRFKPSESATVEYRHKNNAYIEHRELIGTIDAIINENLKGE